MENKLGSGLVLLIVLFAILPYSAGAASEDNFIQNTSSGNIFGAGDNLQINQDIQGDVVLAGSRLEINGNVVKDFIGAGGDLTVNGNISGNVIAAGGTIKVNGNVGGDMAALGGQILLSRGSVVNGDILLSGGDITLDGIINGNGQVSADTLRTGDNFRLKGNLKLKAQNYPSNLKNNVGGDLNITSRNETQSQYAKASAGFDFFAFIIWLLMSLVLGLILIYIFPGFVSRLKEIVRDSPLKTGLLGLLTLIFLPILAVILLITFFGLGLSVLLILLLALGLLIATVPVELLAGEIIYNKIFKKEAGKLVYYLIGAVIFAIAYEIPLIGGIIRFIALLIGLGAAVVWLGERATPGT
jgi:cytoskeletal protein CcmA (bactofilin family)